MRCGAEACGRVVPRIVVRSPSPPPPPPRSLSSPFACIPPPSPAGPARTPAAGRRRERRAPAPPPPRRRVPSHVRVRCGRLCAIPRQVDLLRRRPLGVPWGHHRRGPWPQSSPPTRSPRPTAPPPPPQHDRPREAQDRPTSVKGGGLQTWPWYTMVRGVRARAVLGHHPPPKRCVGRGGGTPPPLQGAPSPCPATVPLTPNAGLASVTDSNRPQPLRQPPPTACLTALEAAEAPSLPMRPCPPPPSWGVQQDLVWRRWPGGSCPSSSWSPSRTRFGRGPARGALSCPRAALAHGL